VLALVRVLLGELELLLALGPLLEFALVRAQAQAQVQVQVQPILALVQVLKLAQVQESARVQMWAQAPLLKWKLILVPDLEQKPALVVVPLESLTVLQVRRLLAKAEFCLLDPLEWGPILVRCRLVLTLLRLVRTLRLQLASLAPRLLLTVTLLMLLQLLAQRESR
jgi:hypothetical protein